MRSGTTHAPPWRDTAPTPTPHGAPWRTPPPPRPRSMRWWKLAGVAAAGLLALGVATWAVFWLTPPRPAHLVVLAAGYDNTLAVPPNPYGKAAARDLSALATPGNWLGTRSRLNGSPNAGRLTRVGLPDLSHVRDKCVVVFLAAHGGRDRDGAFLFPEDSGPEPNNRLRIKAVVEQLAKLPAKRQKLLVLDATEPPAYADLGLVLNDFAAAVEDLNDDIAAVPNLAVFMSTGPDQRSWSSPEWGHTSFMHHVLRGLEGAADENRDKRITGAELVEFVRPRVHDWARDNRAALQTPVLLPRGDEGENRVAAMHLAMTEGPPAEEPAPTPFDPPPELGAAWAEYRSLATAYVPPTAYTPHLWRQYEAWTLRYEQCVIAGDTDGARNARAKAVELKRQIEAARRLDIAPQTLAIQSAVGGLPWEPTVPPVFAQRIGDLAKLPLAERPIEWPKVRTVAGYEPDAQRVLWCRALMEWTAADPVPRLREVPSLVPLVTEGMRVRPAEINFLLMLAKHLPPTTTKEEAGPALEQVIRLRLQAEQVAGGLGSDRAYPFVEYSFPRERDSLEPADVARRNAEDLSFVGKPDTWASAKTDAANASSRFVLAGATRVEHWAYTSGLWSLFARIPALSEWVARESVTGPSSERAARDAWFRGLFTGFYDPFSSSVPKIDREVAARSARLRGSRPEFEGRTTPRGDAVNWWHEADAVLTVPLPGDQTAAARRDLVREFRRTSRHLLVLNRTKPESLPEQTPEKAREVAFESANRRGNYLLRRLGPDRVDEDLNAVRPGETAEPLRTRLDRFAFQADGRRSLAEAESRLGELLDAVAVLSAKPDHSAVRWIRFAPDYAAVSDTAIQQLRRQLVRDYLIAQAKRTYLDHWHGENNAPYYRPAIEQLAADARGLGVGVPNDAFASFLAFAPFPVKPTTPPRFAVTDEPRPELKVAFDRKPPAGVEGFPVFWSSPAFPPAKPEPGVRVPVPTSQKEKLPEFVRAITPPVGPPPAYPVAEKGNVRITGFFRGRTDTADVPVDVYRTADRVAMTTPGLASTAISVKSDPRIRGKYGLGVGAVAIVLDCSGSLGSPDPKDPGLYPRALKALRELLAELPPGTTITVSVFGSRTPNSKAPEETIREVLPPTPLDFDTSPILKKVDEAVTGLEPWDFSPIVRAVVRAKNRIKDEPVPFKAVVLISDAIDNRFAEDPLNTDPKRSVKDMLRAEFPPAGVSLSVVALEVPKSELPAQAEFKEVEKLKPDGLFVPDTDVKTLANWLRTGLNPQVRFSLEGPGAIGGTDLRADNWYAGRIEPGTYTLKVNGARDFSQTVELRRGDRLLLDLFEDRGVLAMQRHWSADTAAGVKSGKPNDPWRLALQQNRSEAGGLRLFVAIEDRPQPMPVLSGTRIGDVWFEARPVVPNPTPVALRWRAAHGYAAPSWGLDVPGWPVFPGSKAGASPAIEAWWNPGAAFAGAEWKLPAGRSLMSLAGEEIKLSDTAVTLDSVSVEEHAVIVDAEGKREARRCLVVRLSHPAGSPSWVRPLGVIPTGSEVRVYRSANRVTCLFWGFDHSTVTGFDFVSLHAALKRAEELGHHATLDNAPGPSDSSPRPEPPVELK